MSEGDSKELHSVAEEVFEKIIDVIMFYDLFANILFTLHNLQTF